MRNLIDKKFIDILFVHYYAQQSFILNCSYETISLYTNKSGCLRMRKNFIDNS